MPSTGRKIKTDDWIVPGLGIYFLHPKEQNWQLDEVVRQISFLRNIKLDGQAYFRNRFLVDNTKGVFDELKEHFYTQPAAIPGYDMDRQHSSFRSGKSRLYPVG